MLIDIGLRVPVEHKNATEISDGTESGVTRADNDTTTDMCLCEVIGQERTTMTSLNKIARERFDITSLGHQDKEIATTCRSIRKHLDKALDDAESLGVRRQFKNAPAIFDNGSRHNYHGFARDVE
jgi:hypothetical protein